MPAKDKILIVEDEKGILSFMTTVLSSNGYDVISANSGAKAITMVTSHCPDLVILDLGANDYVTKPFGTSELLARIRTALRHTRTAATSSSLATSGRFKAGGLEIDYDKRRVFVDGQSVHLTQSEYKIVSMLGLYSGRVPTYDYMLRELWGMSTKENRQILRVNMANIRRKLEKNPAEPQYIFTEIGVGYWMREED